MDELASILVLKLLGILFLCGCSLPLQFGLSTNTFSLSSSPLGSKNTQMMNDISGMPKKDIMVSLHSSVAPMIIQSFALKPFNSREEQVSSMVKQLQVVAEQSQAPVLNILKQFGVPSESYWVTNQIFVKGASPSIVEALESLPTVKLVRESLVFPLMPIVEKVVGKQPNGTEWNVKQVMTEELWKKGVKGEGVVIASIDTGVRLTHVALKDSYVGDKNYGWHDPIFNTKTPSDAIGHGTHTVGTMVGINGIGIAPQAKWMACLGCSSVGCMEHTLIACGQFLLCPSDPTAKNSTNCTNIPHIINNSWGGPGGKGFYNEVINAWKAAGILAIFANGNNGPKCETASSPGDHGYPITVGATDRNNKLAGFSSRGPKVNPNKTKTGFAGDIFGLLGQMKGNSDSLSPEICAPGANVLSADHLSDAAYKEKSGTSMAAPLVAGAAALLLSVNPKLTQDELRALMISSADQNLPPTGTEQCGSIVETEFPNNMYGFGRLNVYEAYKKLMARMKENKLDEEETSNEEEGEVLESNENEDTT